MGGMGRDGVCKQNGTGWVLSARLWHEAGSYDDALFAHYRCNAVIICAGDGTGLSRPDGLIREDTAWSIILRPRGVGITAWSTRMGRLGAMKI